MPPQLRVQSALTLAALPSVRPSAARPLLSANLRAINPEYAELALQTESGRGIYCNGGRAADDGRDDGGGDDDDE